MVEQITPAQLPEWIQAQTDMGPVVVLDVREPWEVQTASVHASGFELVCMPMQSVPLRLQELPADRPIACLCHHGGRSMQVAQFLSRRGFTRLANIAGGIHAWSSQVDPSVPTY